MPKPARRPKEPGVGFAGRLGTEGGRRRAGPTGRPGGRRSRKTAGRSWGDAGGPRVAERADPQGDRGARKTTEGPGGDRTCGSPRRQDPQGGRKGDETHKSAGRSRGGRPRAAPRGDRIREATGAQDDRRGRGRDPGLAGNLASSREQPGARREPCSGPRTRTNSQGSLAPDRERDPIRKALESEVGTREKARSSGGRRATMRGERAARSCPQDRRRKGGARERRAARRPLPG